jgi:hydroxymethylglutaryl-CoA lyase
MKETVIINEVGLRDGLQNQSRFVPTQGKLALAEALIAAGVRYIEAASFVHPKAVPQMADALEVTQGLPHRAGLHYMALVPNLKGYERARAAGYTKIAVVVATTETFNRKNIKMSKLEAENACREVIAAARADGIVSRAYISGALACPYDGPVPVSVTHQLAEHMIHAGAEEISISDTIGAGNPRQIEQILMPLVQAFGPERFNLHLHDTRGQALAMAWAGIECGIRNFDASIGGLGGCPFAPGASGNVATEDLVYMLSEAGYDTGINWQDLRPAVQLAEELTGQQLGGRILQWVRSQELRACQVVPEQ